MDRVEFIKQSGLSLPLIDETTQYLKETKKTSVYSLLKSAKETSSVLVQARSGIGSHFGMVKLLKELQEQANPDIQSITIDSYTRLKKFNEAKRILKTSPERLNGYPLIAHGYLQGRALDKLLDAPLEVRHGSPDARELFEVSLASGITSFEGGGLGYNIPYCKNVPLSKSLQAWQYVDTVSGMLAEENIIIDRELFGTLSAVLMPPCISLAVSILEAILAARAGVRCISIAYPQGGNLVQDVAALQAIPILAKNYLPKTVGVFVVLHQFMGMFPKDRFDAEALILYGGITAKLGKAQKIITKTYEEAHGIPTAKANADGIRTARLGTHEIFNLVRLSSIEIEEELNQILDEVKQLVDPTLNEESLIDSIVTAFNKGWLDVPFSTSQFVASQVIPARDGFGAIRILEFGKLSLNHKTRKWHLRKLGPHKDPISKVYQDICFFSEKNK